MASEETGAALPAVLTGAAEVPTVVRAVVLAVVLAGVLAGVLGGGGAAEGAGSSSDDLGSYRDTVRGERTAWYISIQRHAAIIKESATWVRRVPTMSHFASDSCQCNT